MRLHSASDFPLAELNQAAVDARITGSCSEQGHRGEDLQWAMMGALRGFGFIQLHDGCHALRSTVLGEQEIDSLLAQSLG